jgi:hypothetical protein
MLLISVGAPDAFPIIIIHHVPKNKPKPHKSPNASPKAFVLSFIAHPPFLSFQRRNFPQAAMEIFGITIFCLKKCFDKFPGERISS